MRRVVVAPDKFKGSVTATAAAAALATGLARDPDLVVVQHPIADGGEGTVALLLGRGFAPIDVEVTGPLGGRVTAVLALASDGRTAVVESAHAIGVPALGRAPDSHTAVHATSRGVGELMLAALDCGVQRLVVGLGGSISTDGGAGALQALGARIRTAEGAEVVPGGAGLAEAASLGLKELDSRLAGVDILLACDVDTPLLGPQGAAAIYGPQKGAAPAAVEILEAALANWADVVADVRGREDRLRDGTGAAGGLAFGLCAVLGARLAPGIDWLLDETDFSEVVAGADLIVVGEGSLDQQSLRGKGPIGIARAAAQYDVPVVAVVGRSLLTPSEAMRAGLGRVYALADVVSDQAYCMSHAEQLLSQVGEEVARHLSSQPPRPHRSSSRGAPEPGVVTG